MIFSSFYIEDPVITQAKREAYILGYKTAIEDMKKRLKLLDAGSDLLYTCSTVSWQEMIDVTVPKEVYKKFFTTKDTQHGNNN